jgi:hypothetical protein
MICMPACLARRMRADITAGMVPLPGNPMPMASVRQFMELAVNMPAHEPQVGQADSSISQADPSLMRPDLTAPTASKTVIRSILGPWVGPDAPASIGPPLT